MARPVDYLCEKCPHRRVYLGQFGVLADNWYCSKLTDEESFVPCVQVTSCEEQGKERVK